MSALPLCVTSQCHSWREPKQCTPALQVEFIDSAARLWQLENSWRNLWAALQNSTPFQSPEWLLPCWENYGEGDLCSFAFYSAGELVGLALLYIYKDGAGQPAADAQSRLHRLFLLGTGNTDYLDVLVLPEFHDSFVKALALAIRQLSPRWDICEFLQLRPCFPLLQTFDVPDSRSAR